ncbi:hypothetical protein L328_0120930 [Yersinia pestis 24H]|nr:hypothetical protein L328_0120930 [Yersinia pestis 24H]
MLIHAKAKQPKLNDNKSLKHEQTTKIAYVNRVKNLHQQKPGYIA